MARRGVLLPARQSGGSRSGTPVRAPARRARECLSECLSETLFRQKKVVDRGSALFRQTFHGELDERSFSSYRSDGWYRQRLGADVRRVGPGAHVRHHGPRGARSRRCGCCFSGGLRHGARDWAMQGWSGGSMSSLIVYSWGGGGARTRHWWAWRWRWRRRAGAVPARLGGPVEQLDGPADH